MASWDSVTIIPESEVAGRSDLIELIDSGWGQLVGWVIGVARMRRVVDKQQHMTTITHPATGHTVQRPRSSAEQAEIESLVNAELAEAGVPPRPAGYRWYVLKPPSVDSAIEFWAKINDAQRPSVRPEHVLLQEIVDDLYPPG